MNEERLKGLLDRFSEVRLLVVGDYFLDQYLVIDPGCSEVSLETGRDAHQVVDTRSSPGACGTVTSNLASLGVGQILSLGIIGEDGHGDELMRGLCARGVQTEMMIRTPERWTPAYIKPMRRQLDGTEEEMERLDVKNRTPTAQKLEDAVIARLRQAADHVHGVIIGDQVQERNCGVITDRVRGAIAALARERSEVIFLADSRARIGLFREVMIKPNEKEAADALGAHLELNEMMQRLHEQSRRPVFLTRGAGGIWVYDGSECRHFPACKAPPGIDPVGAGDSATAGIVSSLCAGAEPAEAAQVGNLVASVTIGKRGTTGTASQEEVLEAFRMRAPDL